MEFIAELLLIKYYKVLSTSAPSQYKDIIFR